MAKTRSSPSLEARLIKRYGELMTADDLAALLRYSGALTLKRAIASQRIPLPLKKVGRQHVIPTSQVAAFLVSTEAAGETGYTPDSTEAGVAQNAVTSFSTSTSAKGTPIDKP